MRREELVDLGEISQGDLSAEPAVRNARLRSMAYREAMRSLSEAQGHLTGVERVAENDERCVNG